MTAKAALFATAFASLAFCIEAGAENGRRTLDLKAFDDRNRLTVTVPGAEELHRAEDAIGFAADWALEANLQNRSAGHKACIGRRSNMRSQRRKSVFLAIPS